MEEILTNFENGISKISKEVEDFRELSTKLIIKAQNYDEEARKFEEKIELYKQEIEILKENAENAKFVAKILRRESKKIKDKAKDLLNIEIGDFNEKARELDE